MKHLVALFLISLVFFSLQAQEALRLPWANLDIGEVSVDEQVESFHYDFFPSNNDSESAREYAGLTIHTAFVTLSVDQIMKQILEDNRPDYQPAKVTILEKHTGFDELNPWALFTIESRRFQPTGQPQSVMFLVKKGEDYTFIAHRTLKVSRLPGKTRKAWLKFFRKAEIVQGDQEELF